MDQYDRQSKLKIGNEDLEQAKFFLTLLNRVAVRVGAEYETPVNVKSTDVINDYDIDVQPAAANTEVEVDLPADCKLIVIKTRKVGRLRIATEAGETADGDTKKYQTIGKGGFFMLSGSKLLDTKKLYCRCTTGDNILEVLIAI